MLSELDIHLFHEGRHFRLDDKLGVHMTPEGAYCAVWAPHATSVSVITGTNDWTPGVAHLERFESSGVWGGIVRGLEIGHDYKIWMDTPTGSWDKADPFAYATQVPPAEASVVADLDYDWSDHEWMESRKERQSLEAPWSIYEVHLGSWRRNGDEFFNYRQLGEQLAGHCNYMGFTHVELLPVMEHPYYPSWGYQSTSYFAPSARYGTPADLMHMINTLHEAGIGVILDWVPAHFPADPWALANYDGTPLFEAPYLGRHPDWDTLQFDFARPEVRSFLISSARFWLEKYHADGLRVDAVASMLYLDYSREPGQWSPNEYGGNENLGAIRFMRELNEEVYRAAGDIQTMAEESTAWPMVSRPTSIGGLGFGAKWDMGWMHDSLHFFSRDPIHRRYHHNELTFRSLYMNSENYVLPLSHDEVVHGKGSLLSKMPGDDWQRFANLRLLFGWQHAQPGKKLLFMGSEIGPWQEWDANREIEWWIGDLPTHGGIMAWVRDLNHMYRNTPALHRGDCRGDGMEWLVGDDVDNSTYAFLRTAPDAAPVLCAANATPIVRRNYQIGVPVEGMWRELLNSDGVEYGGSGVGNFGAVEAVPLPRHGREFSLTLTLPPLAMVFLAPY